MKLYTLLFALLPGSSLFGQVGDQVTVFPSSVTLAAGATEQFSARVYPSSNQDVYWVVCSPGTFCCATDKNLSGGGTVPPPYCSPLPYPGGDLSQEGLYIAPNPASTGQTVTISAFSVAEPLIRGNATITFAPASITVTPGSVTLAAGQSQRFTATVSNMGNENQVFWSLNPSTGTGTISQSGLYTAPKPSCATPQTVTVKATPSEFLNIPASATVTLADIPPDLNLTGETIGSGSLLCRANNSITAGNGFTVDGAASVTFQAGNLIYLLPGFQATSGSASPTFHAFLGQ